MLTTKDIYLFFWKEKIVIVVPQGMQMDTQFDAQRNL